MREFRLVRTKSFEYWTSKAEWCSVDKIVPSLWYIEGNIVLCINRINTIKNNITLCEMRDRMPWRYLKCKKKILKEWILVDYLCW